MLIALTVLLNFAHVVFYCASWQYNTVGLTSIFSYSAIPFGYILDWIFFSRTFGLIELLGAALIFGTNITIVTLKLLSKDQAKDKEIELK